MEVVVLQEQEVLQVLQVQVVHQGQEVLQEHQV